jgi:hypothetical protein
MASGSRISDGELAAINAAAVTQEYRVKPHLGAYGLHIRCERPILTRTD